LCYYELQHQNCNLFCQSFHVITVTILAKIACSWYQQDLTYYAFIFSCRSWMSVSSSVLQSQVGLLYKPWMTDEYGVLGKSYPCNRPWRPIGLWEVKAPTFSRQSAAVTLSALRASRPLPPRKIPGTHFCYRPSQPRATMQLERLGQLENPVTSSGIKTATFWLVA
jgi:hypothetical protein